MATKLKDTTPDVGQVLVFTELMRNYGYGYDINTGIFQAPVAGNYIFTVQLCPQVNIYLVYNIIVDGKADTVHSHIDRHVEVCSTSDTIVLLKAGSRVWVEMVNSGSQILEDHHRSQYFAGVLINILRE